MQKTCALILSLSLTVAVFGQQGKTLTYTGRILDYKANPVEEAQIAVYERKYLNDETSVKMIAPIVKTDQKGYFTIQIDFPQSNTFIVAQKNGLALAWDALNYSRHIKNKGYVHLVMEKAFTVTGIVVDHTGKAVAGVKVQALPKTSYISRLRQQPILAPEKWFTVETDSQGRFQFDQFAADVSCDFWVKAPQFGSTYKFTTHYQNACGFEVWRSDIRLVLPQEGNIKGRVVEAGTGKPIGGVELVIQADRERENILNRYCIRTIMVDANGTFECVGLPEGKSIIELAELENKMTQWVAKPTEVNVVAGQTTGNVQVLLEKGEFIKCTVRENGSEQPLESIRVSIYGKTGSAISFTDKAGTVRLRISSGEYQAYASGEGYISWRVNEPVIVKTGEVTHLDILLDKSPVLKGSVINMDGQPAKNVSVTVHPFGDHVYTDQDGMFTAGYDEERAGQGVFVMARDPERLLAALVLTKESKKPVELILGSALTVKGQITDPNGIGIPAGRVDLSFHYTNCLSDMGVEVLTDPQGYYTLNAIAPVNDGFDYRVSVNAAGFGAKEFERITIEGKPGTTTNVQTIQLTPANVSISGIVEDANGLPAARVPIFLHGADGFDQPDKSTATNKDGRFVINRICKGPLRLQANFSSSPGGAGFLYAKGGDRDVKIVLGQEGTHVPQNSLIGNKLPELKNFGINLSQDDTEDKKILICFFDMEQRPSRHRIIQLAKQAEQFKNKGVSIFIVQASKIEYEVLNQWVKKYNIQFPIGIVQDNAEKIRFEWGVRSLPWLILTDKKHVVTAEGFGVDELKIKLEQIRG